MHAHSTFQVAYTTAQQVLGVLPSYYVATGDSGYDLLVAGEGFTVRCLLLGTDTASITHFENNFKASCQAVSSPDDAYVLGLIANKVPLVEPRTLDGRMAVRMTTASRARNFNLKCFSFILGDPSTLKNLKALDFSTLSDVTMTCYDSEGATTTDPAVSVKSVLDWEPTYNYEIIGGWMDLPQEIVGGTTDQYWVSCVGVPDIPFAYGGSVPFVSPVNMERVFAHKIVSDGRASQYLTYNATYHTNKIRWQFLHPAGVGGRMQLYVETFQ